MIIIKTYYILTLSSSINCTDCNILSFFLTSKYRIKTLSTQEDLASQIISWLSNISICKENDFIGFDLINKYLLNFSVILKSQLIILKIEYIQ